MHLLPRSAAHRQTFDRMVSYGSNNIRNTVNHLLTSDKSKKKEQDYLEVCGKGHVSVIDKHSNEYSKYSSEEKKD